MIYHNDSCAPEMPFVSEEARTHFAASELKRQEERAYMNNTAERNRMKTHYYLNGNSKSNLVGIALGAAVIGVGYLALRMRR